MYGFDPISVMPYSVASLVGTMTTPGGRKLHPKPRSSCTVSARKNCVIPSKSRTIEVS